MVEADEIQMFYGAKPADWLRAEASHCDERSQAAQADGDPIDAKRWRERAIAFRRIARDKEFSR